MELACQRAYADSCHRLAIILEDEHAGKWRDLPRAIVLYRKSCEKGSGMGSEFSCSRLAFHYQEGTGVRQSQPRALTLWERACKLGAAKDCQLLYGWAVERGEIRTADKYRHLACKAGDCPHAPIGALMPAP